MQIQVPLNATELFILKELYEATLSQTYHPHFQTKSVIDDCEKGGHSHEQVDEAILCLVDRGYIGGTVYMGGARPNIQFTDFGFEAMCEKHMVDYDQVQVKVAQHLAQLSESSKAQLSAIAQALELPFLVTHHFVEFFVRLGWVKWEREGSEFAYVTYVSPLLKRALELK